MCLCNDLVHRTGLIQEGGLWLFVSWCRGKVRAETGGATSALSTPTHQLGMLGVRYNASSEKWGSEWTPLLNEKVLQTD